MRLFISYAHKDLRRVERIAALLRKAGHDPWFDERMVAGQKWKEVLRQRIADCDTLIYLITPTSLQSEWCQWELFTAAKLGKPVIPVLLEKVALPVHLKDLYYADLSQPGSAAERDGFADLLGGMSQIAQTLAPDVMPPAPADPQGIPAQLQDRSGDGRRRDWLIAVAGLVVSVLGLVAAFLALVPESTRSDWLVRLGVMAEDSPIDPAAPGEQLLLLAPYLGGLEDDVVYPERYVRDALERRVEQLEQDRAIRLALWPDGLRSRAEARALGDEYHATLVVWGEYDDVGGVRTFVEIIPALPQAQIQQGGSWLALTAAQTDQQIEAALVQRDCFLQALPDHADYLVLISLGVIELGQGRTDDARTLLTEAIGLSSERTSCAWNPAEAYIWRAAVAMRTERYADALDDLNQAVRLAPQAAVALEQRGAVWLALGNVPAAQQDFEAALALHSAQDHANRAALLSNIGLARELAGDLDGAWAAYEQAWALNQQAGSAEAQALNLIHFGSIRQRQQAYTEAQNYYDQALTLARQAGDWLGEANALENLGLTRLDQQQPDEAFALFDQAMQLYQQHGAVVSEARMLVRYGMAYFDQSRLVEAGTAFARAADNPHSTYYQAWGHLGLGLVALKEDDTAQAQAEWEQALALMDQINSPDAQIVRQALGQ